MYSNAKFAMVETKPIPNNFIQSDECQPSKIGMNERARNAQNAVLEMLVNDDGELTRKLLRATNKMLFKVCNSMLGNVLPKSTGIVSWYQLEQKLSSWHLVGGS